MNDDESIPNTHETLMDDLMKRAYAAYFRSGATDQPSERSSGVETAAGLQYVVLRNTRGVLAVYRVRNDGMLKGLKRWPAVLDDQSAPSRREIRVDNPLPRTKELLALDRKLTAAEKREVAKEVADAEAEVRSLRSLAREMQKAARAAR